MTVRYPTLEDYLHSADYALDLPVETVTKATRIERRYPDGPYGADRRG